MKVSGRISSDRMRLWCKYEVYRCTWELELCVPVSRIRFSLKLLKGLGVALRAYFSKTIATVKLNAAGRISSGLMRLWCKYEVYRCTWELELCVPVSRIRFSLKLVKGPRCSFARVFLQKYSECRGERFRANWQLLAWGKESDFHTIGQHYVISESCVGDWGSDYMTNHGAAERREKGSGVTGKACVMQLIIDLSASSCLCCQCVSILSRLPNSSLIGQREFPSLASHFYVRSYIFSFANTVSSRLCVIGASS